MTASDLAREIVTQLAAAGMRDVVICPGSRSAPFAYALADAAAAGWLRTHVRVDERGAGFFAVGLARAALLQGRARPIAVITTSGTAVANLHPAVLEASHSGLPLLVLSADRPHELRGTGANQTTWQPGMFAAAVRASFDLPAGFGIRAVRGQMTRLVAAALGTLTRDPGPVHLNVGLREPLVPQQPWSPGVLPDPVLVSPAAASAAVAVDAGRRTVVVAGDGAGPVAAEVAHAAGWPLLAEPTSGARIAPAVTHYQALLTAGLAADVERILVYGHPTLSRPMSALLARPDLDILVVGGSPRWTDVAGAASAVIGAVTPPAPEAGDLAWLHRWQRADAELAAGFQPCPIERAVTTIWNTVGPALVLGSSNTIRVFDRVAVPARPEQPVRAVANRGLAGIDGTIATAAGLAAGLGEPVRAVVGDLTFLHDLGSLAQGGLEDGVDLQIVVLNDEGGGIFSALEHRHAAQPGMFQRYFAAPQQVNLAAAAAAFGCDYAVPDIGTLAQVLDVPPKGRMVVELRLHTADYTSSHSALQGQAVAVVRRAR